MPLPALPESNTKRYFLVYTCPPFTHRLQIRCLETATDAAAIARVEGDFGTLINDQFGSNVTFDGLEVAAKGSDIRNPVAGFTPFVGGAGTPTIGEDVARTFSVRGRSPTGRKTKLLLFGMQGAEEGDFLLTPGGGSDLLGFIAVLNGGTAFYKTIDESSAVWKPNLTLDYNDHYIAQLRGLA